MKQPCIPAVEHPRGKLAGAAQFGRDLPARLHFEQLPEASPYDGMVVDEGDPEGLHLGKSDTGRSGTAIETRRRPER